MLSAYEDIVASLCRLTKVRGGINPIVPIQHIASTEAIQRIIPTTTDGYVIPKPPAELIVATTPIERVVAPSA